MSPEAHEQGTQAGSEKFIDGHHPTDGVRAFKHGDLSEVHDDLLERGVPDPAKIDPITLDVQVDKIPIASKHASADTILPTKSLDEKKSKSWKKWVGGVIGGTVLLGGGYSVNAIVNDGGQRADTSLAPDFRDKPNVNSGIESINSKASPENIKYVIDNPVNTSDYPYVEDQIVELGKRWNVVMNAGEPDFAGPVGTVAFTAESLANFAAMTNTFLDPSSPNYSSIAASIQERSHQIGSMFYLDPGAETQVSFVPTETGQTPLAPGESTIVNANVIWSTNQPDTTTGDGKYNNDYNADFTLVADADGTVRVYSSEIVSDLGNIG